LIRIRKDRKAGGTLYEHLRRQGKKYRKSYGTVGNRTGIPNRVDIDERPEEAIIVNASEIGKRIR